MSTIGRRKRNEKNRKHRKRRMIAERLEQRQLLAANPPIQVIDDGDPGFNATGDWVRTAANPIYYRHHSHKISPGESGSATWTFNVDPGLYQVSAFWQSNSYRSEFAPFTISTGNGNDVLVEVNQESAPDPDSTDSDYNFEDLGSPVYVSGGTLTVSLTAPTTPDSNDSNSIVLADAVRIERVQSIEDTIIDEFNSVYENVELEFYKGFKKGPEATETSRSGNAWDQAALLVDKIENNIELANAGVTARLVRGDIVVTNEELQAWVGTPELQAAKYAVAATTVIGANFFDDTVAPRFRQPWVQVTFPNSSGSGTQSVRLDPSWKIRAHQPGVRVDLPGDRGSFDEFGFLAHPGSQLPIEYYEDRVMDYLAAQGKGQSLADVPLNGPIVARSFAGGLVTDPHLSSPLTSNSWDNIAEIFNNGSQREEHTYRMRIQVGTKLADGSFVGPPASGGGYETPFSRTITIPESSLDTFAVERTPTGFIYRVNGVGTERDLTIAAGTVPRLILTHAVPGVAFTDLDDVLEFEHDISKPNRLYTISIGADQFSNAELDNRRAAINAALIDGEQVEDIDEVLDYMGARYWYLFDKYSDEVERLMHVVNVSTRVNSGVVFADKSLLQGDFSFQQVPLVAENSGVDYPNAATNPINMYYDGTNATDIINDEAFQLSGYTSSALEHAVLEEILHSDSISTVQGLKDAFVGDAFLVGVPTNSVWVVESVPSGNTREVYLRGEIGNRADEGSGSLAYEPDQIGTLVNKQQFFDRFSGHRSLDGQPAPTYIGATNTAIYSGDTLIDHGYIMFSSQSVHDRFGSTVHSNNSDHLIIVDYNPSQGGGGWQRYNNFTGLWSPFSPVDTDVLLAKVDFTNNAILSTYSQSGSLEGIKYAHGQGDLTFTAGGSLNWQVEKFFASGTYFEFPIANDSTTNRNIEKLWNSLTDQTIAGTATALVPQELNFAGNQDSNWIGSVYLTERDFTDGRVLHTYKIAPIGDEAPTNGGNPVAQLEQNQEIGEFGNETRNFAGDPVDVLNGNMFRDEIDIALPNIGVPLDFTRHYDSQSKHDVGLGRGWVHSFSDRLLQEDGVTNELTWLTSEGTLYTFTKEGSNWETPSELFGVFAETSTGYVYKSDDGIEHHFKSVTPKSTVDNQDFVGRVEKIVDQFDNGVVLDYVNSTSFNIKWAKDAHMTSPANRRALYFSSTTGGHISEIKKYVPNNVGTWNFGYNTSVNKLLTVTNPEQETVTYKYHNFNSGPSDGLMSRITEVDNSYHAYEYYPNGRVFRVKEGIFSGGQYIEQSSHSFSYDQTRNLTEFTDENGNVETYIHQDDGRLVRQIHDDRTRVVTEWGLNTDLSNAYDDNDDGIYDGSEHLQRKITDEVGAVETFRYYTCTVDMEVCNDPDMNFKELRLKTATEKHFPSVQIIDDGDPRFSVTGDWTTLDYRVDRYQGDTNLIYSDESGVATWTFDVAPGKYQVSAFWQHGTYRSRSAPYTISSDGAPTQSITVNQENAPAADANESGFDFGNLGAPIVVTGNTLTVTLSEPLSQDSGQGVNKSGAFADAIRIERVDAIPLVTTFDYRRGTDGSNGPDDSHIVKLSKTTVGSNTQNPRVSEMVYDSRMRLQESIDPLMQKTEFDYYGGTLPAGQEYLDELVQVRRLIVPGSTTTSSTTTFAYDAGGLVTSATTDNLPTSTTIYHHSGTPTQVTDATGRVTARTVDTLGRVTAETSRGDTSATSDDIETGFTLDERGRLVGTVDALGRVMSLDRDRRGNVVKRTYADRSVDRNEYDAFGNQTSATDAAGRTTRFVYDNRNRLIQSILPDGSSEFFRYDGVGRIATSIDVLGRETHFRYDANGRLLQTNWLADTPADPTDDRSSLNRYSQFGELVESIDTAGNVTQWVHDELGRESKVQILHEADNDNPDNPANVPHLVTTTDYDLQGNVERTVTYDGAELAAKLTTLLSSDPRSLISSDREHVQITTTTYDAFNRPTEIEYDDQTSSRIEYDDAGRVEFQYDELDRVTEFKYDTHGRLEETIFPDPDGTGSENQLQSPVTKVEYDDAGNRTAIVDANTFRTTFEYDKLNRLVKTTDAELGVSQLFYNPVGQVVATIDPLGRVNTTVYDSRGRIQLASEPDPDGDGPLSSPQTEFKYDAAGNLKEQIDPNGTSTTFDYDAYNQLTQEEVTIVEIDEFGTPVGTSQVATRKYDYDDNGNLIEETNTLDQSTNYSYDSLNRLIKVTTPDPDGTGSGNFLRRHAIVTEYDGYGNVTSSLESRGEDADNETTFGDNMSSERRTVWTYDDRNRVLTETLDAGRTTSVTTTYEYDDVGNVLTQRTGIAGAREATTWLYDNLNRVERETLYTGGIDGFISSANLPIATFFHYDAVGNLTRTTEQILHPTVGTNEYPQIHTDYEYDKLNRQTKLIRDAEGGLESTTEFEYDAVGNLRFTTDPLSQVTENQYDQLNRLIKTIGPDPDGPLDPLESETTTFTYDAAGNLLSQTNGENEKQRFVYDSVGRIVRSFDGLNAETTSKYDTEGNLLEYTDPELNTTTYSYDHWNRLIEETIVLDDGDPNTNDDRFREYRYDAQGNIDRIYDRDDRERRIDYDRFDRREREVWVDPSGFDPKLTWRYDLLGRLTYSHFDGGTYDKIETFKYDGLGRVTRHRNYNPDDPVELALTTDPMVEQRYEYDLWIISTAPEYFAIATKYSQHATTDGSQFTPIGETTSNIDRLGRATRIQDHAQSTNGTLNKVVFFTYDPVDQLKSVDRNYATSNGDIFDTDFGYDSAGRLTSIAHDTGTLTPTPISSFGYEYDKAGRIEKQTSDFNLSIQAFLAESATQFEDFTFDDAGQLTSDDGGSYQYDDNGNRDGSQITIGDYNRLTADSNYTYEYSDEGNLTRRTASDGTYTEYEWDFRNSLEIVAHFLADDTKTESIRYRYNADGQLVDRKHQTYGTGAPPAKHSTFIYNGSQLALGYDASSDELEDRYLWAPGVDRLLSTEAYGDVGGVGGQLESTLWAATDHLGTVNQLIDNAQTVVEHRQYDSFGNITEVYDDTGTGGDPVDSVFAFAGRRHDEESGLYYNRARWYEPESGRFIGEDPIGFADGPNPYTYAGNDPVNFADPSGLTTAHPIADGLTNGLFSAGIYASNLYRTLTAYSDAFTDFGTPTNASNNLGTVSGDVPNRYTDTYAANLSNTVNSFFDSFDEALKPSNGTVDYILDRSDLGPSDFEQFWDRSSVGLTRLGSRATGAVTSVFDYVSENGWSTPQALKDDLGRAAVSVANSASDAFEDFLERPTEAPVEALENAASAVVEYVDQVFTDPAAGADFAFDAFVAYFTGRVTPGTLGRPGRPPLKSSSVDAPSQGAGLIDDAAEAVSQQPNRIYSAHELIRRGEDPGPFHNFPESFNKPIFEQGTKTTTPGFFNHAKPNLSNDSIQYRLPGTVNGREGTFEIFTRPSVSGRTEVIMHRFFKPNKK